MKILEPTEEHVREAAEALLGGKLVGLPTETVYGIAAHAFDEAAVRRTFEIKERPPNNPLIVHLAGVDQVPEVAAEWPSFAATLADRFWPGPLTLVVPKAPKVPMAVTGGLDTVAVRVPLHPVAQLLLSVSRVPLSAPSANRFMGLSPTRAEHLDPSIADALFCILDGGPCEYGIESTVVDCSGPTPHILRPGGISRAQIERCLGPLESPTNSSKRRSPGQYERHYAPRAAVRIVEKLGPDDCGICLSEPVSDEQIQLPADPGKYASRLYEALRTLDLKRHPQILIEAPPDAPEWEAVWDRLRKASG